MLSALTGKSPAVKVALTSHEVFVHPSGDPSIPSADPLVSGQVALELSAARAVSAIKVVLEGLYDVRTVHGLESSSTLHKELNIDLSHDTLDKGTHTFDFSFIVPSSTAAFQRCEYGRVRHSIRAVVEFRSSLQPNLTSAAEPIFVSANPFSDSSEEIASQVSISYESADLGPIKVLLSSSHLTIASLLTAKVDLLALPKRATLISIRGVIIQRFIIHYADGTQIAPKPAYRFLAKVDSQAELPPPSSATSPPSPSRRNSSKSRSRSRSSSRSRKPAPSYGNAAGLCATRSRSPSPSKRPEGAGGDGTEPDGTPLKRLEPGEEFFYSRVMRVPVADLVRPSTLPGSEGKIRVSHELGVEIRYSTAGDETERVMLATKPATIASCCVVAENLYLPPYESSWPVAKGDAPPELKCTCSLHSGELLARDGRQLERAGQLTLEADSVEAEEHRANKTPAYTTL